MGDAGRGLAFSFPQGRNLLLKHGNYGVAHSIAVPNNFVIPEPRDSPTLGVQETCAPFIVGDIFGGRVSSAIDLDHQPGFDACEVRDVWAHRMLSPEAPVSIVAAQPPPHQCFG